MADGKTYQSKFIITGVGCLSKPYTPPIPGLENFKGEILHTAQWPKKDVKFNSKDVAVIGTGSSGVQIIPEIAMKGKSLTVLQRTANFSIPARNHKLNNEDRFNMLKVQDKEIDELNKEKDNLLNKINKLEEENQLLKSSKSNIILEELSESNSTNDNLENPVEDNNN